MSQQQNNKQDNKKDWKDNLLKSSLPLEQLVSEKLENCGLHVLGEYPYIRPNQANITTEFSVDLRAIESFKPNTIDLNNCLNFLIECKYSHPGTQWVFSSHTKRYSIPRSLYAFHSQGEHRFYNDASFPSDTFFPGDDSLPDDTSFPGPGVCTHGIVLHDTGPDPNTITRGLSQLLYGMPNLVLEVGQNIQIGQDPKDPPLFFICLILVTTADLYILKHDQNLEDYRSAKSLDEVAEKVDRLNVAQARGPHLQQYCEQLFIPNSRLDEALKVWNKEYLNRILPKEFQIIVVHLDALDNTVTSIQSKMHHILQTNAN